MAGARKRRVGVVLSGCGFLDGSEIHEATLTLLSLDRRGAQWVAIAPDLDQRDVVDHRAKQPSAGERRGVLSEAARISRGEIRDLASIGAGELDALVFPGGFGAAKTLCTFASEGVAMTVDPGVERLILESKAQGLPMGFICIAPVLAAKVLGGHRPLLTIGNDPETARAIEALGGRHQECKVDEVAVDEAQKLVSTPAYMLDCSISQVAQGIDRLVSALLELS